MERRRFLLLSTAMGVMPLLRSGLAVAETYPSRSINLVVPYDPGGGVDTYARAVAAAADGTVSVPLVVANKPGAGGLTGAQSVLTAEADGYTLLVTSGGSFLLSTLLKDGAMDALESFEFVGQIGDLTSALMVPTASPYNTAEELIEDAKTKPGKLRWAHPGRGTFHNVAGLGFMKKNGISAQDVPFKGGGPSRAALMGAQTDFGFLGIQQLAGFEEKLRALGVVAPTRDGVMKDVPTFEELGIPYSRISSPVIILAPKGTPVEALSYLEKSFAAIMGKPSVAETLVARGTAPQWLGGAAAKAALAAMKEDALPLIKDLQS